MARPSYKLPPKHEARSSARYPYSSQQRSEGFWIRLRRLRSNTVLFVASPVVFVATILVSLTKILTRNIAVTLLMFGALALGVWLIQDMVTSRSTDCRLVTEQDLTGQRVVMCQHTHRDFFLLRATQHPPFQLESAEITTYQASRSKCDNTEYYTAYQLDVVGRGEMGRQSVTMKSYDDNSQQAKGDLKRVLGLLSGETREPVSLGDSRMSWLMAMIMAFVSMGVIYGAIYIASCIWEGLKRMFSLRK